MKTLITGSIAFDYLMTFPGYFKDYILPEKLDTISLSFLVDSLDHQRGGVAPNIAYAMALLGQKPILWAAVGNDFEDYRNWLDHVGVNTTFVKVFQDVKTASFFVNTDLSNNQIASFYPGAMAFSKEMSLKKINIKPDLVVISPNDPSAMSLYVEECIELDIAYVFDPSQQIVRLSRDELIPGIIHAKILFSNEYEAALITKITGLSPQQIADRTDRPEGGFVVITRGEEGADIYTPGLVQHVPAIRTNVLTCPTGVGDAFRGGFLTGLANHFDLITCARIGNLTASYCLEKAGSQGYHFTQDEFKDRFRELFDGSIEFSRSIP
jgi:adenosine kinase